MIRRQQLFDRSLPDGWNSTGQERLPVVSSSASPMVHISRSHAFGVDVSRAHISRAHVSRAHVSRLIGIAWILCLMAGCSGPKATVPDAESQPLRIALHAGPSVLDPHLQSEAVAQTILSNIYETLVAFDSNMRLEPRLAETWDNPSDLVWRFQLRRGVRFHDGTELTLDDVVVSLQRAMSHPSSRQKGSLVAVAEVRKTGDWTLELETSKPYPILLNRLAFIGIVPAGAPEEISEPIGTGPYRFVRQERKRLLLEAVPGHWRVQGHEHNVEYLFETDAKSRVDALLRAEIDVVDEVSLDDIRRLQASDETRVLSLSSLKVSYLHMDPEVPPFDDLRVRRAVHLALDRQGTISTLHAGHGLAAGQMVSRNVFGHNPELLPEPRDLVASKRLLEEAGFRDGLDLKLEVRKGRRVDWLVDQLAEAGIRIEIRARPWDEAYAMLLAREAPFYFGSWICTSGDAGDVLDRKLHTRDLERGYGDTNHAGYSNPKLDQLIERSNELLDLSERQRLLQQALSVAQQDLVYVPIYSRNEVYGLSKALQWAPRQDEQILAYEIRR